MADTFPDSNLHLQNYKPWVERKGFKGWFVAIFFWLIPAFILFQMVGGIVAFASATYYQISTGTAGFNVQEVLNLLQNQMRFLIFGNTAGQILMLGLGTWLVTRLHVANSDRLDFLRIKVNRQTGMYVGLIVGLIVLMQPLIWFLGWLNAQIPLPDVYMQFEQSQMELLKKYLQGDYSIAMMLFNIALTPAICEEIMYRGYLLRVFEKDWGPHAAILATGLIFGIYHLRLTQFIPLAVIGGVLAYVAWKSDSLLTAVVGHLVNNGGSIFIAYYYPDMAFAEMTPDTMPPAWTIIASTVLTVGVLYYIARMPIPTKQK